MAEQLKQLAWSWESIHWVGRQRLTESEGAVSSDVGGGSSSPQAISDSLTDGLRVTDLREDDAFSQIVYGLSQTLHR